MQCIIERPRLRRQNVIIECNPTQPKEQLTEEELTILKYAAEGKENQEIAAITGITAYRVRARLHIINTKLCTKNRTQAVIHAILLGLLTFNNPPSGGFLFANFTKLMSYSIIW